MQILNKHLIIFFTFHFSLFTSLLFCQTTITGKVYDFETMKTLSGATIQLVGTSTGIVTKDNGSYTITLPDKNDYRVKISYLGYVDTTININQKKNKNITLNIYLKSKTIETKTVFVTANRSRFNSDNIPSRIAIIDKKEIEDNAVLNADDILQTIPGMNVDRDFGIFSKNASVTMRGLSGTPRTLILLDGIPLNKTDGGGINWNRINPDIIDKIEVIKGPVSTIYGGNAMSGVINVITQRPQKKLEGNFKAFYGTYNTYGATGNISGQKFKNDKGFYYGIYGYYKKGDGYIIAPDSTLTEFNIKTFLNEYSGSAKGGYQFNPKSYLEVEYTYYDDKRGEGKSFYEEDGTYNKYTTNSVRTTFNYESGKNKILVNSFYQYEDYFKQNETMSIKKNNKYTLYNTNSDRIDKGIWCSFNRNISNNQIITLGIDTKQGSVDASDIYFTSPDILTNKGTMNFLAFFSDYQISLLKNKLKLNAGLRYDFAQFINGSFTIENPSTLTAFMVNYPTNFSNTQWQAFSPKLAAKYFINDSINLYIVYAKGFRAPMLDDMCKNGNITKGFKIANPQLIPETLDNYELGFNINFIKGLLIQPSVYYSIGNNFQYFVGTGDSINTGGDNLKPMLQRQNISKAKVIGTEISVNYRLTKSLLLMANYAYNNSTILEYNSKVNPAKDLTGKYIMEVPPNQFFVGLYWKNKYFNAAASCNFVDKQWSDDENTLQSNSHYSIDMKLSKIIRDKYTAAITVHDILNNRYLNSKGELSPGRFFMMSLAYRL